MRLLLWLASMVISFLAGALLLGYRPPPVEDQPVTLVRQQTFRILAPKGYEDVGHVVFNCQPAIRETVARSGLNGRR